MTEYALNINVPVATKVAYIQAASAMASQTAIMVKMKSIAPSMVNAWTQ
jgi:hypothetical protein